jgi:hypothetical protein
VLPQKAVDTHEAYKLIIRRTGVGVRDGCFVLVSAGTSLAGGVGIRWAFFDKRQRSVMLYNRRVLFDMTSGLYLLGLEVV